MVKTALLIIICIILTTVIFTLPSSSHEIHYIPISDKIQVISPTKYGFLLNSLSQIIYLSTDLPGKNFAKNKSPDQIFDTSEGQIFTCIWLNREVNDPSQNASFILIRGADFKKMFRSRLSVQPSNCTDDILILVDNYPNNPGRKYTVMDDTEIFIFEDPEPGKNFDQYTKKFDKLNLPRTAMKEIHTHPEHDTILIEDDQNGVWIIYRTTLLRRGISYLQRLRISK